MNFFKLLNFCRISQRGGIWLLMEGGGICTAYEKFTNNAYK